MAEITWVKLKTDMFDNEKIKLIEALPDKDTILIIWIKLIAYAGKVNAGGYIMLTEKIPMNEEELATVFGRPLNTVRLALSTFERYGMITRSEAGAIKITNWDIHQNIDGMDRVKQLNAARNRKYRERKKQELLENKESDVSVTSRDGTDRDIDKDLDIDIETDKEQVTDGNKVTLSSSRPICFDTYEQAGFGMLNPLMMQKLDAWIKDFGENGDEIVSKALETASDANKRTYKYTNGILKNWFDKGFRSVSDIEANERQREANKYHASKPKLQSKPKTYADFYNEEEIKKFAEMSGESYESIANRRID